MKMVYGAPEMEIVLFEAEDVISTSATGGLSFGGVLDDPSKGDRVDWEDLFP